MKQMKDCFNTNDVLYEIRRQIHDVAVFPKTKTIDPYVNLKAVDAIISNHIKNKKEV